MNESLHPANRATPGYVLLGGVLGLALAGMTDIFPTSGLVIAAALVVVLASTLLVRPVVLERLATIAGALLGSGLVFLFGVGNTFLACQSTSDFCGRTNVVPLMALSLLLVASGSVLAAAVLRSDRQRDRD